MDVLWTNLPPITKTWCLSTIIISTLLTLKKLKFINLLFIPDKIINQGQNWRILTTFITFGELSIDLIFKIWEIQSSCSKLENSFLLSKSILPFGVLENFNEFQLQTLNQFIERNKTIDFFYFFGQICLSIILCSLYLHYKFKITIMNLGSVLIQIFIYYESKLRPLQQINFFGILQFNNLYYPYFSAFLNLLLNERFNFENDNQQQNQQQPPQGGPFIFGSLRSLFNKPVLYFYLVSFILGHFWWFSREIMIKDLHYNEENDDLKKYKIRKQTLTRSSVWKFNIIRELLVFLLLPPWYWIIISKIKNQRQPRQLQEIQHPL
ncbi:uncharacterized protein KGF55_002210 [Candida pseudojiufengensis]|uniref:uncharacterized protein n=1 Tax=Candida pseudojiufengensis TaxID=497109 RepID=UPI002224C9FE|nr:uncharacterized protein KGF55_002210 [Candida pseudojiufengensis]KAI5964268.1 hypothetical protein KGF55_002210 [Candida pseudojiufengensis]